MKPYAELYSSTYRSTLARRIDATGRWTETGAIDSHIEKISAIDDLLLRNINTDAEPLLVSFNALMEEYLNNQIKTGNYHMDVPLLTRVEIYDKDKPLNNGELTTLCAGLNENWEDYKDLRGIYENYYYGRPANDVSDPLDLTFYRGSYLNITDVDEL